MRNLRTVRRYVCVILAGMLILPLSGQQVPVKIGLLLPDQTFDREIRTAEAVIDHANDHGGYGGQPIELVVRTVEGPWGAGSKESVSLVYEDKVLFYLGALDGRNAHLAEQVAAKSHLAYIETRATEPTLTQAYVPWFLRVVPNDNQQAEAIMELIRQRDRGSIAILTRDDSDTRHATRSLVKVAARLKHPSPVELNVDSEVSGTENEDLIIEEIAGIDPGHLVVPFWTDGMEIFLQELKLRLPDLELYGTLAFAAGMEAAGKEAAGKFPSVGIVVVSPGSYLDYLADAVSMGIHAVMEAGPDREAVKEYLMGIDYTGDRTGPISFDDLGNRRGRVKLVVL